MKRKFCITACFVFILGFSGIANAAYFWDLHILSQPMWLTAYNDATPDSKKWQFDITGLGAGKGYVAGHHTIENVYAALWLSDREPNGHWDGGGIRPDTVHKERALFHLGKKGNKDNKWKWEADGGLKLFQLRNFDDLQKDGKIEAFFKVKKGDIHLKGAGLFAKAAPVPEPGTILLMGIGLVGLAGYGRRKIIKP